MERSEQQISPQRLCEAAEAALAAAAEVGGERGQWPYPLDLMGAPEQPRCLCDFTRHEIEQASRFLVRLGMIEAPLRRRAS